jgi:hypothetical protein
MLPTKADDVSSASLDSSHHSGGWKIRQLVFWPKNPIFKLQAQIPTSTVLAGKLGS